MTERIFIRFNIDTEVFGFRDILSIVSLVPFTISITCKYCLHYISRVTSPGPEQISIIIINRSVGVIFRDHVRVSSV